jgi:uncharacterized protein
VGYPLRLLVEFSHPAQVHKFKNAFVLLRQQGVEILILSRDKDVMLELLDELSLNHRCISRARSGILGSLFELMLREYRVLLHVLKFRPLLLLSAHSVAITHIGWLLGIPRLVHEDTEFGSLQQKLYVPFASKILTSTAYYLNWGKKQVRIPSLEPLAYLHPNYFTADASRLSPYELDENTRYAVIRIIAWQAIHDRGLEGIDSVQVQELVGHLRSMGYEKIVLSSEEKLGGKLSGEVIQPAARDLHQLIAFSQLCLSESISVAGEAAVLGIPTLLVNPLRAGHSLELEKYGLLERHADLQSALQRAMEISNDKDAIDCWAGRRRRLLEEKSDMTREFTEIISRELAESSA